MVNNTLEITKNKKIEVAETLKQKKAILKAEGILKELQNDKSEVPIDVFPIEIQDFIKTYFDYYKFPLEYYFGSVLSVAGTIIGNNYAALYHNGWWASPLMWIILVGSSSNGKSQVMSHCNKVLKDKQKQYIEDNQDKIEKWKNEKDNDIPKPRPNQIYTNKATIEAIIDLLNKNPKGFILMRGELMGWLAAFNQYSNGDTKQTYMEIWDNEELIDNKKGDGLTYIPRPFVNVLGGVQTEIIEDIAGKDNAKTGFFQRFLFALPDDNTIPMPREGQPDLSEYDRYEKIMTYLIDLPTKIKEPDKLNPNSKSEVDTIKVPLSIEAKALFFKYRCDNTKKMNTTEDNITRSLLGKLTTYVLRFSIVMELLQMASREMLLDVESMEQHEISIESVQKAIRIANYFEHTAKKVTKRIESPVSRLQPSQQAWYNSLSENDVIKQQDALIIAKKLREEKEMKGLGDRTIKNLFKDKNLFKRVRSGGYYERIH